MSEPTPPGGRRGASRGGFLGLPWWGWGVIAAAGLGTIVFLRLRRSGAAAAPATDGTSAGTTDQQSQYEQITSQLTGIEGTDQALLAAIKDMQGDKSKEPDNDRDDKAGSDRDSDSDRAADRREANARLARRERRVHAMPTRKPT